LERRAHCSLERAADFDEELAYIFLHGSPCAIGVHDFQIHQGRLCQQRKSIDQPGHPVFRESDVVHPDRHVDIQRGPGKNGHDPGNDIWGTPATLWLAL
jgi:hypothetical protein